MRVIFLVPLLFVIIAPSDENAIDRLSNDFRRKHAQNSSSIDDEDRDTDDVIVVHAGAKEFIVPELPELGVGEKREICHYEQTMVVRDYNTDAVTDKRLDATCCEIFEVYKEQEAAEALEELASLDARNNVTMGEMMYLLRDCDVLDDNNNKARYVEESDIEKESEDYLGILRVEEEAILKLKRGWLGIVPGTKWCGRGDIADNYHDLGLLRNVDRCCRAHDLCPIKVLGRDQRYGLKNSASYTKSHCFCDEAFYACLKGNNGFIDKTIGKLYFNVVSPDCIEGLPEFGEDKMKFVSNVQKW